MIWFLLSVIAFGVIWFTIQYRRESEGNNIFDIKEWNNMQPTKRLSMAKKLVEQKHWTENLRMK